jgi:hypothetical protein
VTAASKATTVTKLGRLDLVHDRLQISVRGEKMSPIYEAMLGPAATAGGIKVAHAAIAAADPAIYEFFQPWVRPTQTDRGQPRHQGGESAGGFGYHCGGVQRKNADDSEVGLGTSILTAHIERAFERKDMYLRGVSKADVAVGALLRRSARMTRAIVALGKLGFGADAVALSRSLIDHWIVLRWITNQDSEARARLFWFFEAKQKERVGEVINKYPPSRDQTPLVLPPKTRRIAEEYPRWDS